MVHEKNYLGAMTTWDEQHATFARENALLRGAELCVLQPFAREFVHASHGQLVGVKGDLGKASRCVINRCAHGRRRELKQKIEPLLT